MAIVTYVAPYSTYRGAVRSAGSLEGQVTYPIGGANYSRAFVQPANPQSDHQVAIRALMTTVSQGFAALTEVEADAWRAAAVGVTRQNPAGQTYELSGANLYALINLYRLMDGEELLDAPPALTAPGAITDITDIEADVDGISIDVTHALGVATDFILCRVTAPLPSAARNARPNEYRCPTTALADSIVAAAASPQTINLGSNTVGILADDYVGVELLPLGPTYWPGVAHRDRNIIVSTPT
jgi:hypothetical protein